MMRWAGRQAGPFRLHFRQNSSGACALIYVGRFRLQQGVRSLLKILAPDTARVIDPINATVSTLVDSVEDGETK